MNFPAASAAEVGLHPPFFPSTTVLSLVSGLISGHQTSDSLGQAAQLQASVQPPGPSQSIHTHTTLLHTHAIIPPFLQFRKGAVLGGLWALPLRTVGMGLGLSPQHAIDACTTQEITSTLSLSSSHRHGPFGLNWRPVGRLVAASPAAAIRVFPCRGQSCPLGLSLSDLWLPA